MATNGIKALASGASASVLSQAEYEALPDLETGYPTGILPRHKLNKTLKQATLMAAVLAQFIVDGGSDVDDTMSVPALALLFKNVLAASGSTALIADLASNDPSKGSQLVYGAGRVVATISELRSLLKTKSPYAFVLAYYSDLPGGGGAYRLDLADTTSLDNGGTVIVALDGGRWKLVFSNSVSAAQFGVRFDNASTSADSNTSAFNACFSWAAPLDIGVTMPPGVAYVKALMFGSQSLVAMSSRPSFLKGAGGWQTTLKAAPGFTGTVLQAWSIAGAELSDFVVDANSTATCYIDMHWGPGVGPSVQNSCRNLRGVGAPTTATGPLFNARDANDTTFYKVAMIAANPATCAMDLTAPGGLMWMDSCIWSGGFLRFGGQNGTIANSWGHGIELAQGCLNYLELAGCYIYANSAKQALVWSQSFSSFQSTRALTASATQWIGGVDRGLAVSGTAVGTTCTVTTSTPHGQSTGGWVTISDAVPTAYNGTFQVTVTGTHSFTYTAVSSPSGAMTTVGRVETQVDAYFNLNAYSRLGFDSCQWIGPTAVLLGSSSRKDSYSDVLVSIKGGSAPGNLTLNEPSGFRVECEGMVNDSTGYMFTKNNAGTFTPTVAGGTTAGTATYSTREGAWSRIGNRVFFELRVTWSGHTGSGQFLITGLPFTQTGPTCGVDIGYANNPFAGASATGTVGGGTVSFYSVAGAAFNVAAGGDIIVSGSYPVAA